MPKYRTVTPFSFVFGGIPTLKYPSMLVCLFEICYKVISLMIIFVTYFLDEDRQLRRQNTRRRTRRVPVSRHLNIKVSTGGVGIAYLNLIIK
jgi:hypothetical protein